LRGLLFDRARRRPHPPLHDRVHPGHPNAAQYDLDAGIGDDGVEQRGEFAVPIAD
jgi:hypothetical protein